METSLALMNVAHLAHDIQNIASRQLMLLDDKEWTSHFGTANVKKSIDLSVCRGRIIIMLSTLALVPLHVRTVEWENTLGRTLAQIRRRQALPLGWRGTLEWCHRDQ